MSADQTPDRRRFVRNLALGGAAVAAGAAIVPVAVAVPALAQTTTTVDTPPTIPAGDVTLVNYAIGIELAVSQLYTLIANTGKLSGEALDAARNYISHHSDHAAALATLAANQATGTANAKLLAQYTSPINGAADAAALEQIAFEIESSMAATHQMLMGTVTNWQTATTVATLEPVEAQHAVVWGQMLNLPIDQWIPPFESASGAFDPVKYAGS